MRIRVSDLRTGFSAGPSVVVRAPAKVNLFLEVLGRRSDGYHEIATLMVAVRLFDTLMFQAVDGAKLELSCDRADLSTGPDNLILKAAHKLQEKTSCRRGASIRLVKRIPMAAGLAGGSTDAAATFAGLNRLWQLGCGDEELAQWSAEIGSDVPFFFHTPAAWCTGRGEIATPVPVGKPLDLVLVCPRVGLATAAVYRGVVVPDKPLETEDIVKALTAGDIEALGRSLHNRLQPAAEHLCPVVAQWYARLAEFKPAGQLMSGSGSSLFALCRNPGEAQAIYQALAADLCSVADKEQANLFLVRSCL